MHAVSLLPLLIGLSTGNYTFNPPEKRTAREQFIIEEYKLDPHGETFKENLKNLIDSHRTTLSTPVTLSYCTLNGQSVDRIFDAYPDNDWAGKDFPSSKNGTQTHTLRINPSLRCKAHAAFLNDTKNLLFFEATPDSEIKSYSSFFSGTNRRFVLPLKSGGTFTITNCDDQLPQGIELLQYIKSHYGLKWYEKILSKRHNRVALPAVNAQSVEPKNLMSPSDDTYNIEFTLSKDGAAQFSNCLYGITLAKHVVRTRDLTCVLNTERPCLSWVTDSHGAICFAQVCEPSKFVYNTPELVHCHTCTIEKEAVK